MFFVVVVVVVVVVSCAGFLGRASVSKGFKEIVVFVIRFVRIGVCVRVCVMTTPSTNFQTGVSLCVTVVFRLLYAYLCVSCVLFRVAALSLCALVLLSGSVSCVLFRWCM